VIRYGWRVTLVDRRGPLQGATAATTALLRYEIDVPLTVLQHHIGHAKAARAWRRSKLGLESLAATEYLTRQALQARNGITRGAALRSFDTLSVDPLKLAAGFLRGRSSTGPSFLPRSRWRTSSAIRRRSLYAPAPGRS
jgi:hypothetical protein